MFVVIGYIVLFVVVIIIVVGFDVFFGSFFELRTRPPQVYTRKLVDSVRCV